MGADAARVAILGICRHGHHVWRGVVGADGAGFGIGRLELGVTGGNMGDARCCGSGSRQVGIARFASWAPASPDSAARFDCSRSLALQFFWSYSEVAGRIVSTARREVDSYYTEVRLLRRTRGGVGVGLTGCEKIADFDP